MIPFSGREAFPVPVEQVYARLTDAAFLVSCLPDAEVLTAEADRAVWKLKPKLSFLSGSLDTDLQVAERIPTSAARYLIHGKAVGAASTTTAELRFASTEDGGTAVNWSAEITSLTGLLKMVPKGLVQAAAEKVIADVWAAIRDRIKTERG